MDDGWAFVSSLQVDGSEVVMNENGDDDEDEDVGGDVEGLDTDEEYVPTALPIGTTAPRGKRKGRGKAVNKVNGTEAVKSAKKGPVQCPTCNKTFLSRYYLKVHNR